MKQHGNMGMYNYANLEYEKNWYRDVYDAYLSQDWTSLIKKNDTSKIVSQYLKYTTSHGRTKINPLVFTKGAGPFLIGEGEDIFLDFGSGIYVTNLGHSHPKVSEAISLEAKNLMNCHDYITPVKAAYLEKLSISTGSTYNNIHLYD